MHALYPLVHAYLEQDVPHGNLQLLGIDGAGAICVKEVERLPAAAKPFRGSRQFVQVWLVAIVRAKPS